MTTIGAGTVAVVENVHYNNELDEANAIIAQKDNEAIEASDNDELLEKINTLETNYKNLEEKVNGINYDGDIESLNSKINTINKSISSSNHIVGKWKRSYTEDGVTKQSTYEFKSDGTFYIDGTFKGYYNDTLIIQNLETGYHISLYDFRNDAIYLYQASSNSHGSLIYYYNYATLTK